MGHVIATDDYVRFLKKLIDRNDALKVKTTAQYKESCSAYFCLDHQNTNVAQTVEAVAEHIINFMLFCKSLGFCNSTDPHSLIENIVHESHGERPCYCLPTILSWYVQALERAVKHSVNMLDYI
jgi:hypothetical protein